VLVAVAVSFGTLTIVDIVRVLAGSPGGLLTSLSTLCHIQGGVTRRADRVPRSVVCILQVTIRDESGSVFAVRS
jgi:hypothetical protein